MKKNILLTASTILLAGLINSCGTEQTEEQTSPQQQNNEEVKKVGHVPEEEQTVVVRTRNGESQYLTVNRKFESEAEFQQAIRSGDLNESDFQVVGSDRTYSSLKDAEENGKGLVFVDDRNRVEAGDSQDYWGWGWGYSIRWCRGWGCYGYRRAWPAWPWGGWSWGCFW